MLKGIGVTEYIAIGNVFIIGNASEHNNICSSKNEKSKLIDAIEASKVQLKEIISSANKDASDIMQSHLYFLDDPSYIGVIKNLVINLGLPAVESIEKVSQDLYNDFFNMDDDYFRGRAQDIKDIAQRLVNNVNGTVEVSLKNLPPNSILLAHELLPSQTAQIDRKNVVGFITEIGSTTSHTAIMAKTLEIAAVVGCSDALKTLTNGSEVIVDGVTGYIIPNPDNKTIKEYKQKIKAQEAQRNNIMQYKDSRVFRANGKEIIIAANIGNPEDAKIAKANGASAIGLFRTEFLYMTQSSLPSEDEQYNSYMRVLSIFDSAPVIVRTLDIGGDKELPLLNLQKEDNPFLGVRAIRLCLQNHALFKTQLRALLRASYRTSLKIMFPMISTIKELEESKMILEVCKRELIHENQSINENVEVGMMIEIPAAALLADQFAKEVSFFSIGSNDLTQYTMAVDRGNTALKELYDCNNPAVLKLIKKTIDAAHKNEIMCAVCGEMASQGDSIPILSSYDLDEYSVSLDKISYVKSLLLQQKDNHKV